MVAPTQTKAVALPVPNRKARTIDRKDQEFLPAAIEIVETPPSPIGVALLLYICGTVICVLAWSYFGWIDIYAVATGKIQPSGQSKIVQPATGGKVSAIHVENGSRVAAGDLLIELDSTETAADRAVQQRSFVEAGAEVARRRAAIAAGQTPSLQPPPIAFPKGTDELVRLREENVLNAELGGLRSSIATFKAQLLEKKATKERLLSDLAVRKDLMALGKERAAMEETLVAKGAGARAKVIDATERYQTYVVADAGDRGQLLEVDAAMSSLETKAAETVSNFIAHQTQKLAEADREREKSEQSVVKAQMKHEFTKLRAPIAGTVQQLSATTIGQVVSGGQTLLTIVPIDGPIEVEALIANRDIGFIEPGQSAVVKVESFPYTRYGTLNGTVSKVSRDGVDSRFATNLSDATSAAKEQGAGSSQGAASLTFPVSLKLEKNTMSVDGSDVALRPGMAVTVEVRTGRRRAIDYVLSPLREFASESGHER